MPDRSEDLHRKASYLPDTHRLLPQGLDAERGVLGSLMIDPLRVADFLIMEGVTPQWFHLPAHEDIFRVAMALAEKQERFDFITLTQELRNRGQLDRVGGAALITEIFTFIPTAANVEYYVRIVKEKFVLREMIRVCTEYAARSYEETEEVFPLLERLEVDVLGIQHGRRSGSSEVSIARGLVDALTEIESLYERKGSVLGLATGFPDIDKILGGLRNAEMVVVAGRPSQGKTAFAMNVAEFVGVELKKPIGVFSLEMSTQQLLQRLLCSRARVNLARVRDGFLSQRDFPALQNAASALAAAKIFIDDSSDLTIQELRAKARRMKQKHAIEALFVDYLQLLRSTSKKSADNRQQEVSEVSAGLKACAKELGIPVIVLAQISRKFDHRQSMRPRLADLRESGAIEQDADTVAFLVRPEVYAEELEDRIALEGKAEFIIAKQRNGPVGDVPLTFLKEFTRFETRARDRDADEEKYFGDSLPM